MLMAPFRNMTIGFFLLLAVAGAPIGQDNSSTKCPTISVTGPAGVISRPELVVFIASIENANDSLKYLWSVSGGIVVTGQGTPKTGLPRSCPNLATESAQSVCDPERIFYGIWTSYGEVSWEDERKEIDSLVVRGLREQPTRVAYMEKTFREAIPWKDREAYIRKIQNYVYNIRKIPKRKFLIKQKSLGKNSSTLAYLVPPDSYLLKPYYLEC